MGALCRRHTTRYPSSEVGLTIIDKTNNYSESTTLRATVVYPPSHPSAGQTAASYNGKIKFSEVPGTQYYDGQLGATRLPVEVQAQSGVATVVLRSMSDSLEFSGPTPARIEASAQSPTQSLDPDPASNPLRVLQWVDEDASGVIDWLQVRAGDILACLKKKKGEVGTVASAVSSIQQSSNANACGEVRYTALASQSPIMIPPVCPLLAGGGGNTHRRNILNQLGEHVAHESRHAWQVAERNNTKRGRDDDNSGATLKNDDDGDFLLEAVGYPSAAILTEGVSGTGDTSPDGIEVNEQGVPVAQLGYQRWQDDAYPFGTQNAAICGGQ